MQFAKSTIKCVFFVVICLFSSCATLLNGPYTDFVVHYPRNTKVVYQNANGLHDTIPASDRTRVLIKAERSKSLRLPITFKGNAIDTTLYIKPVRSGGFYANILLNYGIGMLVERNNVKSYSYPANVYIDYTSRNGLGYSTTKPYRTPRMQFAVMPGFINLHTLSLPGMTTQGVGAGLVVGVNYFTSPKTFYAWEVGIAGEPVSFVERFYIDTFPPIVNERKWGLYANVRRHSVLGHLDLGYGLSAGEFNMSRRQLPYPGSTYKDDSLIHSSRMFGIGGSFSASYRLRRSFYAGINYQPLLLQVYSKPGWQYGSVLSFGIYWRLQLSVFK